MTPHFSIRVIWHDDDMVEIDATACTKHFSGRTQVYTTCDDLLKHSAALAGFPKTTASRAAFSAGARDSYSFLGVEFYSIDGAGHTAAQITLESNVSRDSRPEEKQRVQLEMQFEPAALDAYLSALDRLISTQAGEAVLIGIGK